MNYKTYINNSAVQALLESYEQSEQQRIKDFITEANDIMNSSDNDILDKSIVDINKELAKNSQKVFVSLQDYRDDFNAYNHSTLDDSHFANESISFNNVQTVDLKTVVSNIKNRYHIFRDNDWLFRIRNNNNIETLAVSKNLSLRTDGLVVAIPDIENNVEIINKEMLKFGYYNAVQKKLSVRDNDYFYVLYNPIKETSVNELLRSQLKMKHYVYHLTPEYNLESIEKQGILAKENIKYLGKRLFCYPNSEYYNDNDFMEIIASMLQKDEKAMNRMIALCIDLDKIPDVEFFLDPNANNCIYCKDDISVDAINLRRSDLLIFNIDNNSNYSFKIKDL